MKKWKAVVGATFLAGICLAEPTDAAPTDAQPILERAQVTGDWFGTRPLLSDHGLEIFGNYTAEI